MKFTVGDRAILQKGADGFTFSIREDLFGKKCKITSISNTFIQIEIVTPKRTFNYGVYPDMLIPIHNSEIHITVSGNTTTAILKENGKVVKRSEAKCSPDDEFDFEAGARLAFDRLLLKEKETELYTGKVACIENCGSARFTIGDFYYLNDGHITDDCGCFYDKTICQPTSEPMILQLGKNNNIRFLKIKNE